MESGRSAVQNLPACIEVLQKAGIHFSHQMEVGPGGRQVLIEDPDHNPIELFEPTTSPRAASCRFAVDLCRVACGRRTTSGQSKSVPSIPASRSSR